MKKVVISIAIIVSLATLFFLKSCSENVNEVPIADNANLVLFEDTGLLNRISADPLDNHIYRIELLGNNEEMEEIVNAVAGERVDISELNIFGIKKYFSNNSDIIMYSIPWNRSENSVIIYRYGNLFQVNIAEFNMKENGITEFRLNTVDGKLYYGMSVNANAEVGEYIRSENQVMKTFSDEVYAMNIHRPENRESLMKQKEPDVCCRQMSDWEGCMDCTLTFFSGKWYGIAAFTLIGKEFVAAIAISCIGAGPSTFC